MGAAKRTALVTGASGRLGRHLIAALLKRKFRVRAFFRGEGVPFPKEVEVFKGDVTTRRTIAPAVEGVDFVFHLAALLDYSAPKYKLFEVNAFGTNNVLEACLKDASLKKFVFCSSTSAMGKRLEKIPADERTPCNPTDSYGESKLMAERMVMGYGRKFPVVVLRPAVIYGEGFTEGFFQVFKALENGNMRIIGSGNNVIPFVHVSDVVQALILASQKGKSGEVYILAGKENRTQRQLLEIASRELGVDPPHSRIPRVLAELMLRLELAKGFSEEHLDLLASNRIFNISKARRDLGYSPKVGLEKGIKEMVEYFRGASHGEG